ncbi:hypothetical protein ABES02_00055 [Neobacillus pocheonensis]|uniref:hypothetical protein n=1 Tax=Neobacillus pocheonensis TaxID=363869 RepID=UPI003D27E4DA
MIRKAIIPAAGYGTRTLPITKVLNVKPGVAGEIQLTDAIKTMAKDYTSYGLEIDGRCFNIAKSSEYVQLISFICGPKGGKEK